MPSRGECPAIPRNIDRGNDTVVAPDQEVCPECGTGRDEQPPEEGDEDAE